MTGGRVEPRAAEPISVKIPEAVRLTGLSRSRLYELMRSGDIEFAKVGSSTLILVGSLRRFVYGHVEGTSCATGPTPPAGGDEVRPRGGADGRAQRR